MMPCVIIYHKYWNSPVMCGNGEESVPHNRAYMIPTCDNIQHKGVQIDPSCKLCGGADEFVSHLFVTCPVVVQVWTWFNSWLNLSAPIDNSVHDIFMHRHVATFREESFSASMVLVFG
ncbi:hypothetical protein RIF29_24355 [Crotalaria pallida]|uniref:Reverse transcriptase zinc-binding domain-containing protein n=1 Tax=Crotalaria pallida TaxID=3830 RepID=A0AAN9ELU6_CROPI